MNEWRPVMNSNENANGPHILTIFPCTIYANTSIRPTSGTRVLVHHPSQSWIWKQAAVNEAANPSVFWKLPQKALNRLGTMPYYRSWRELLIPWFKSKKGSLGVELWSFSYKERISVPMSYIVVLREAANPSVFRKIAPEGFKSLGDYARL